MSFQCCWLPVWSLGLLWSLASLIILSDVCVREKGRTRESFGKCYRKGRGDRHTALFPKLFLIVAVWRRQVPQWQRSKNKSLLIRLWKFSKCLDPLLVDLEEGLLEVQKLFFLHWSERILCFFANYFWGSQARNIFWFAFPIKMRIPYKNKHSNMSCATGRVQLELKAAANSNKISKNAFIFTQTIQSI